MPCPALALKARGLRYLSPMNPKDATRARIALILCLFFASGALALIYQVVWGRIMMHIFGSTAMAVGTVLAGFMAGLATGGWLGGKLADRTPNSLRLYGWLELGIIRFRKLPAPRPNAANAPPTDLTRRPTSRSAAHWAALLGWGGGF